MPVNWKVPFRDRLLAIAQHYAKVGVSDHGNNSGVEVEHFQRLADVPKGSAWCSAFVVTAACEAMGFPAEKSKEEALALVSKWFKPSASVQEIVDDARERNILARRSELPLPGWIVCFHFPSGNHIGVVVKDNGVTITTVEGNTSAPNAVGASQTNGDGIYVKRRSKGSITGYVRLS